MRFPPECKLHLAAATEAGRYTAMQGVQYDPQRKTLAATNGRILAIIPDVELDDDDTITLETVLPAVVIKGATMGKAAEPGVIHCNGEARSQLKKGESVVAPFVDGEFPRTVDIIPAQDRSNTLRVRFSTRLLYDLARALGAEDTAVTLRIDLKDPDRSPIRVDTRRGYGALMPIMGQV